MARPVPEVARELDSRVADLGFELVEVVWAGSDRRPILRIRVDRPEGHGEGVTVDDCAAVSRGLEPWLDDLEVVPERYTLEVSSPGVNRPLVRPRDYERFAGETVAVKGDDLLAGRARRLEGELLGLETDEAEVERVRLRLPGGDEVEIALDDIVGAHIVFRWS
jgi:ribosome maturation factor RimP